MRGEWNTCSNMCGRGIQVRAPTCVVIMSDGSSREVAREECTNPHNITEESRVCHEQICPRWRTSLWSLVSFCLRYIFEIPKYLKHFLLKFAYTVFQ